MSLISSTIVKYVKPVLKPAVRAGFQVTGASTKPVQRYGESVISNLTPQKVENALGEMKLSYIKALIKHTKGKNLSPERLVLREAINHIGVDTTNKALNNSIIMKTIRALGFVKEFALSPFKTMGKSFLEIVHPQFGKFLSIEEFVAHAGGEGMINRAARRSNLGEQEKVVKDWLQTKKLV